MSVPAQNPSASFVVRDAFSGFTSKYIKRKRKAESIQIEKIFRFIKSLLNEYIEAVNDFMKLIQELLKKTQNIFIEIRGRESVLLEGFGRIEDYSDRRIRLASDFDIIEIRGSSLTLRHLSTERIAIDGRIDCVEYCE